MLPSRNGEYFARPAYNYNSTDPQKKSRKQEADNAFAYKSHKKSLAW